MYGEKQKALEGLFWGGGKMPAAALVFPGSILRKEVAVAKGELFNQDNESQGSGHCD